MSLETDRAIKRARNGNPINTRSIDNPLTRTALRRVTQGGAPVLKTGNLNTDKKLRSL